MCGHAQHLNVLSLGTGNLSAFFFPDGVVGAINNTVGYNLTDPGVEDFPYKATVAAQVPCLSTIRVHNLHLGPRLSPPNFMQLSNLRIKILDCHMSLKRLAASGGRFSA